MSEKGVLDWARLPARLGASQTARLLGFAPHDIPVLVRKGLLKPLGHPAPNAPKYFARCEVTALAEDSKWLTRATQAITRYWREKNRGQRTVEF